MAEQDDAAYALVANSEGEAVKCSRDIALMFFLSKVPPPSSLPPSFPLFTSSSQLTEIHCVLCGERAGVAGGAGGGVPGHVPRVAQGRGQVTHPLSSAPLHTAPLHLVSLHFALRVHGLR